MSEYEEITLLDCNHSHSSEVMGGNNTSPANYTNKLGAGVQVRAGDQISIHNSFISDVGATSDSIEFTGKRIENRIITKTVMTPYTYINASNDKPLGYERVTAENKTSSVEVRGNTAKLLINYYKTSNGENCFGLPRRFLVKDKANPAATWAATDTVANGFCYRDGVLVSDKYLEYNNGNLQFFVCSADKYYYVNPQGTPDPSGADNWFKVQNDNSRYKIFVAKETRYGQQTNNDLLPQLLHYHRQTPADYEYFEYIEEIDININTGFNSPSAIAETITDKMRRSQSPQQNYFHDKADTGTLVHDYAGDIPLSLELNSNTYKTFWASGIRLSNETIYNAWSLRVDNNSEGFEYVETTNNATGNANVTLISNLSEDFFTNGILGSGNTPPVPDQIFGGCYFAETGTGTGSTGGFDSSLSPAPSNRYMKYSGNNARVWRTKKIREILSSPGKLSVYYIQGNSVNGGENADNGEDLVLRIRDKDLIVYNTVTISAGADSYTAAGFTLWEYTLTTLDAANGYYLEFAQTTSSGGTFDNYGIKYFKYESIGDPDDSAESNDYLSQYQYIGVKRPDLFIANRKFAATSSSYPNHMVQGYFDLPPTIGGVGAGYEYALWKENFYSNKIVGDLNASGQPYHTIVFNLKWNDTTAQQDILKEIFDAEGNYPELFRNEFNQMGSGDQPRTTVNNSRFLHMNLKTFDERFKYIDFECLGWDYMTNKSGHLAVGDTPDLHTVPIFFDFQPEYKDNPGGGESWDTGYKYGVFKKFNISGVDYVSVTTGEMYKSFPYLPNPGGFIIQTSIPNIYFDLNNASTGKIDNGTYFGSDIHFNAYGNNIIGLTDGYLQQSYNGSSLYEVNPLFENPTGNIRVCDYVNKIYLGADEPLLEFNPISNKFQISQLHTAERVQNRYNADEKASTNATPIKDFETAGDKVYKINKRLYNNNFTPMIMPYTLNEFDVEIPVVSTGADYNIFNLNPNFKAWTIFDQLTGIIIKDFGVSEENWNEGIWGILGFTYEQFNSPTTTINNINQRVGNINKYKLSGAMTNAIVSSPQMLDLVTNAFGSNSYTLQIPIAQIFNTTYPTAAFYIWAGEKVNSYPAITEAASSVLLSAPNLPRKIRNGYFCIRSNVIDNWNYLGGQDSGEAYPILQVLSKQNDTADFFTSGESSITYTFTKPKTITEISTQITNPDMTLATIDENSSVIYKLKRFVQPNFDIIGQIMGEDKPKKK
tara:strand:- start:1719 stop:5381 length:3663 start_codon:yes stop_codon:yes gene_type:complete